MLSFLQKTISDINCEVKNGKAVTVSIPLPEQTRGTDKAPSGVDVVTTATLANNIYSIPQPPPLIHKPDSD